MPHLRDHTLTHSTFPFSLSLSLLLLQSYQNEVRLLTELEHPGIVGHVESFVDGDKQHLCIVMQFCEVNKPTHTQSTGQDKMNVGRVIEGRLGGPFISHTLSHRFDCPHPAGWRFGRIPETQERHTDARQ